MIIPLFRFLKLMIAWLDLLLAWLVVYPLSFLPQTLTQRFYPKLFHWFSRVFVEAMGVHLKLHQKNRRALPEQYIIIANHPSCFEDGGMPALFNARFLAKGEVEHWWFVGRIAKAAGVLFFNRECKDGRKGAREDLIEALEQGDNIGLYPEGGCKGRRIHLPFRYGIFDISIQTGVPIVPVFLHYETQEDFEWQKQHLLEKLWAILTSQNPSANYYVYDAISPSQFENKQDFCNAVQDMYLDWQKRYLD